MKLLSVVVPCYNEEENIAEFYNEISEYIILFNNNGIDVELIYIDDGSIDSTKDEIKKLVYQYDHVHMISFSRNFGKEAAMHAGLSKSKGDYIVVMDVDLQDPPSLLPDMLKYIESGYDSVATRRVTRKGEPPIRSLFARAFYKIMNSISKTEFIDGARDFRMMTRQFVDAVLSLSEYNRFTKGIFSWVGFKTKWIEYKNIERNNGITKWSFWKLFIYSIEGITAFSTLPLSISILIGIIFLILSIVLLFFVFFTNISNLFYIASISLFTSGTLLMFIGVLGIYLDKTYTEVKNRPLYIIKEEI